MMRSVLLYLTLFFCVLTPVFYVYGAEPEKTEAEEVKEGKLSIIELYRLSNELPRLLIDLQDNIEELRSVSQLESFLPEFEEEVKELAWEVNIAESTPDISYHQLTLIDSKLEKATLRIETHSTLVRDNIDRLQQWYERWLLSEKEFNALKSDKRILAGSVDNQETLSGIEGFIDTAKDLIEETLLPNLLAGKKIGEIQTQIYELNAMVVDLIEDTSAMRVQQTSPSMLSKEFYSRLDARLFQQFWENFRLFLLYQWGYIKQNFKLIIGIAFLIGVLTMVIHLSRKLVLPSSSWYDFAARPFQTAVFVFCVFFSTINSIAANLNLPPDWGTLLYLPLFLVLACFSDKFVQVPWQNRFLRRLILFLAATLLLSVVNIPQPVFHLFVIYAALAVFLVSFFSFLRRWRDPKKQTITWAIWLWALFPLVVVLAGIGGYDQLAILLFGRVLVVVAATMMIWLTLQIVSGLLEISLAYFPLKIVRENSASVVRQLFPFLVIIHGVWWLAVILMVFWVHPTLVASFEALTSITFRISTFAFTPGSLLIVFFVCYSTVLCSRALRTFLLQEVLPRYGAEKGVQVSITRLVHYAILTIGFLILLRILGFGLNQIAIVGGALSVGIGFGLQAIVNNFVSGLILLFERPIKVGDMIDVGGELGEVKELGLRATTVQTYDNAEIVIPNSELISASVTNWTLAEKRARVKVPVGVAYGSDIEKVLKILLECAQNNPIVLSTPRPQALFLAFGASSLDFELRVWISDVNDRMETLSQLNQDIENEFHMADVEIPFPQNDLHLRSVDADVADRIFGQVKGEKREAGGSEA